MGCPYTCPPVGRAIPAAETLSDSFNLVRLSPKSQGAVFFGGGRKVVNGGKSGRRSQRHSTILTQQRILDWKCGGGGVTSREPLRDRLPDRGVATGVDGGGGGRPGRDDVGVGMIPSPCLPLWIPRVAGPCPLHYIKRRARTSSPLENFRGAVKQSRLRIHACLIGKLPPWSEIFIQ